MVEKPLMSERENILGRVKEALTALSADAHASYPDKTARSARNLQNLLPAVGVTYEERLALFSANSADLKTDLRPVKDVDAVKAQLASWRDAEK
jgi:hypothetical protein